MPQVKEVDGRQRWVFDGDQIGGVGAASVIGADMEKRYDMAYMFGTPVHEVAAGASQVAPRLEMMDAQGIWAHLIYPNTVGFGGQQLGGKGDPALRNLTVEIYNDAMAEMQAESGNRLFPQAILPWWDVDQCLVEIERIRGLGLVGVNTNADPQDAGLPDLSQPYWDPMWAALADAGLPVNFHIGASASQISYHGSAPWPSMDAGARMAIGSAMLFLANGRIIANLIYGGVLERHPTLKVVSVESGVGWLPSFLNALDYQLDETAPDDPGQAVAEAVGVLPPADGRVLLVRERRRADPRGDQAGRRGQLHVRDRLPAPDVPVPGPGAARAGGVRAGERRAASARCSAPTPCASTTCRCRDAGRARGVGRRAPLPGPVPRGTPIRAGWWRSAGR